MCLFRCLQTSRAFCAGLSPPLFCAGSPSVGSLPSFLRAGPSVNPPLCAGSPSVGTCPFLSCVQVFRPLSPPPPLCVQDPPQRVVPPLSRFCVQVPLSLCRSPSLCAGLPTLPPPLCAGSPSVGSSLSLCVQVPPSLCAGPPPPSVCSSPTPSVGCVQSPLLFCLGAAEQVGSGGSVD